MAAEIISGKDVAQAIREELKEEVAEMAAKHGIVPGLATVLVGENPASVSYVTAKNQACKDLGMRSFQHTLSAETSQQDLLKLVDELNHNDDVHGILVQLPLPKHVDESKVLYAIDPDKDVDGFHPVNVGRMVIGEPSYLPCTPYGIQQMLVRSGVIIDVGVNEIGRTAEGKRILVGDVDFDAVSKVASAITPVPGGVGPMTITML